MVGLGYGIEFGAVQEIWYCPDVDYLHKYQGRCGLPGQTQRPFSVFEDDFRPSYHKLTMSGKGQQETFSVFGGNVRFRVVVSTDRRNTLS